AVAILSSALPSEAEAGFKEGRPFLWPLLVEGLGLEGHAVEFALLVDSLLGQMPACLLEDADRAEEQADRYACPHYQEMGCLLDAFEKTCEEGEDMSELLGMHGTESVWMCCCPMPYQKCRKEDRSRSCDLAFRDIILPLGTRDVNKTLLRSSLLEVRGRLQRAGGAPCLTALAPADPVTDSCGQTLTPRLERSLPREELFCELLAWQWEELGDGRPEEFRKNNCAEPEVSAQARDGDARKDQRSAISVGFVFLAGASLIAAVSFGFQRHPLDPLTARKPRPAAARLELRQCWSGRGRRFIICQRPLPLRRRDLPCSRGNRALLRRSRALLPAMVLVRGRRAMIGNLVDQDPLLQKAGSLACMHHVSFIPLVGSGVPRLPPDSLASTLVAPPKRGPLARAEAVLQRARQALQRPSDATPSAAALASQSAGRSCGQLPMQDGQHSQQTDLSCAPASQTMAASVPPKQTTMETATAAGTFAQSLTRIDQTISYENHTQPPLSSTAMVTTEAPAGVPLPPQLLTRIDQTSTSNSHSQPPLPSTVAATPEAPAGVHLPPQTSTSIDHITSHDNYSQPSLPSEAPPGVSPPPQSPTIIDQTSNDGNYSQPPFSSTAAAMFKAPAGVPLPPHSLASIDQTRSYNNYPPQPPLPFTADVTPALPRMQEALGGSIAHSASSSHNGIPQQTEEATYTTLTQWQLDAPELPASQTHSHFQGTPQMTVPPTVSSATMTSATSAAASTSLATPGLPQGFTADSEESTPIQAKETRPLVPSAPALRVAAESDSDRALKLEICSLQEALQTVEASLRLQAPGLMPDPSPTRWSPGSEPDEEAPAMPERTVRLEREVRELREEVRRIEHTMSSLNIEPEQEAEVEEAEQDEDAVECVQEEGTDKVNALPSAEAEDTSSEAEVDGPWTPLKQAQPPWTPVKQAEQVMQPEQTMQSEQAQSEMQHLQQVDRPAQREQAELEASRTHTLTGGLTAAGAAASGSGPVQPVAAATSCAPSEPAAGTAQAAALSPAEVSAVLGGEGTQGPSMDTPGTPSAQATSAVLAEPKKGLGKGPPLKGVGKGPPLVAALAGEGQPAVAKRPGGPPLPPPAKGKAGGKGKVGPPPKGPPSKGGPPKAPPGKAGGPGPKAAAAATPAPFHKKLYWKQIDLLDAEGTIFSNSPLRGPSAPSVIDVEALTRMFQAEKTKGTQQARRSSGVLSKAQNRSVGTKLLSDHRARNVAIVLKRMPISTKELAKVLRRLEWEASEISTDDLEQILLVIPDQEEGAKLRQYQAPEAFQQLRDVEQWVFPLALLSRCAARVRLLCIARGARSQFKSATRSLASIRAACSCINRSAALREVMMLALQLGNYINHGDRSKGAKAITVGSLMALRDFKTGRMSSLHFLCASLLRTDPTRDMAEILARELRPAERVAKLQVQTLQGSLRTYARDLETVASECKNFLQEYDGSSSSMQEPVSWQSRALGLWRLRRLQKMGRRTRISRMQRKRTRQRTTKPPRPRRAPTTTSGRRVWRMQRAGSRS
ncbi:unnamed protein product, partial [Polarella glacialis]